MLPIRNFEVPYDLFLACLPTITQVQSPWPFCSLCKFSLFQPCTCLEPFAWNIFSSVLGLHNFFLSFWSQLKGRFPVAFPSHSFIPQSHPLPWLHLTIFRALNTASECLLFVPLSASPPDVNCLRVGVLSVLFTVSHCA